MTKIIKPTKKYWVEFSYQVDGQCEVQAKTEKEAMDIIEFASIGDEEGISECSTSNGEWTIQDIDEITDEE